ncbi:MAG: SpoIIE family protein phosphatase [Flammeovirgaceae bacterium]|nr:SpoIIE family protein phosphatase [Flammeovirgaceae bacterium]
MNNSAGQSIQYYDFEQYLPSFNAPVAFMGTQIKKEGKLIGVLIVQIPIDKINGVMAGDGNWEQAGMGDSGESYLVGSDMKMRSDSRFIIENRAAIFSEDAEQVELQAKVTNMTSSQHTSVLYQEVNSEAAKEALAGNTGVVSTTNYLGKKVLSCYTPIQTEDLHWALISEMEEGEVFSLVSGLKYRLLGLILVISIIVTAFALAIAYRISSPILQLAKGSKKLATGDFNIKLKVRSDDEIGYLTQMFNMMAISLEEKKNDILRKNAALAQQKEEIEAQRDDIEIRTNQLAKAYKDIRASINYAQRIQKAKLPQFENLQKLIPDSFIFFKPRDLVSGDFYWFSEIGNKIIITAVDCTGHGVPGAFMSLIGTGLLDEIVNQKKILKPELILKKMHEGVQQVLRQKETENRDGMDMSLCVIDRNLHKMEFAGAKNPLVYIQNGELHHVKGDKHPIGGLQKEDERTFNKHEIDLEQETTFYIFSDGYQDQFGGSENRKFMIKNLKELFVKIHHSPIKTQHLILEEKIQSWMGNDHKQLDDILIIGFTIDPEKFFPTKINLKDYVKSNLMH